MHAIFWGKSYAGAARGFTDVVVHAYDPEMIFDRRRCNEELRRYHSPRRVLCAQVRVDALGKVQIRAAEVGKVRRL